MSAETEVENLVTVRNFAKICDVTPAFIYLLQKRGQVNFVMIDGVAFIDKEEYKSFADKKNTRKIIKSLKSLIKSKQNEQKHNKPKKSSI